MITSIAFFLLLLSLSPFASAYPSGAGDCPRGEAAVGGSHVLDSNSIATGTLDQGGLQFLIDGRSPDVLVAGELYTWSIVSLGVPFRGFLVRLEGDGVDVGDAFFDLSSGAKDEDFVCPADVGGVTHDSNSEKMSISGKLMVDEAVMDMTLDVTVVIENRQEDGVRSSVYYYSGFEVYTIRGPTISPTLAPIAPTDFPTLEPTRMPTKVPTAMPTRLPTKFPTAAPTRMPTKSPTAMPTKFPTAIPTTPPTTPPPTESPTSRPSSSPTISPTTSVPSSGPSELPTDFPSHFPSLLPSETPTTSPSETPTASPTMRPTAAPTKRPTAAPTPSPVASSPSGPSPTASSPSGPSPTASSPTGPSPTASSSTGSSPTSPNTAPTQKPTTAPPTAPPTSPLPTSQNNREDSETPMPTMNGTMFGTFNATEFGSSNMTYMPSEFSSVEDSFGLSEIDVMDEEENATAVPVEEPMPEEEGMTSGEQIIEAPTVDSPSKAPTNKAAEEQANAGYDITDIFS